MSREDDIFEIGESFNTRINNEALKRTAQKEEERFLSILLKDKECLMDCMSEGFKPGPYGHFWNTDSRFLYGIIHAYYKKYTKPLTRTAIDSIMDSLDEIGGQKIEEEDRTTAKMLWDKVYSSEASSDDYDFLKESINGRFVQWKAYEILKSGIQEISNLSGNQVEAVKELRQKFIMLDHIDVDPYALTMNIDEGMDKVVEYIAERRENPEKRETVLTYIKAIDDVFNGFERGSYTVVTGMINGGKSTLMFNIAFNMAKAGHNVVYVSIEKKAIPIFTRLLCLHALVDYNRIKIGGKSERGLSDYYHKKLVDAADDIKNNIKPNLDVVQVAQGTKLSKIIAEVEKIKAVKKIDTIVVDYLGVIGAETHHPGRADLDEAKTSQRLQAYGRINNFVTITGAQLKTPSSKEIRGKAKKATPDDASNVEVNTEDIAGSKMIIADADNALGCVLNSDQPPNKMFVYITKARDDESRKSLTLDFDGKLGRVCDPEYTLGQVKEVDDLVYNDKVSEEALESDDNLFEVSDDTEVKLNESLFDPIEANEIDDEDIFGDDGSFVESKEEPKEKTEQPKEEVKEKQPKEGKDAFIDDIFED